ncbi:hypothetical protein GQ457_03G033060 [Hibiscus cannabinus]
MKGSDSLLGFWLFFYLPHLVVSTLHFFVLSLVFFLSCSQAQSFFLGDLSKSIVKKRKAVKKMMLGKRPRLRPPMKRTTSLTEITFDLSTSTDEAPPSDPHNPFKTHPKQDAGVWSPQIQANGGDGGGLDQRLLATVSPRVHRRHSADFLETPPFLRSCCLCRRRLVPGRDIYMYRGDSAFCSLECRQQQMNQDEKKEKCSVASKKQAAATSAARSGVSAKGETVAAV